MLGLVPLLMAMGLAGITTFLVWKLVSMVRLPNVRVQNVQLKLKGAMRPAGALTAILALALAAIGIWGGVVNMSMWRGSALDATIPSPLSEVLNPRYRASERDQTTAAAALRHLSRAGSWTQGGIGWERGSDWTLRVARLQAIVGDRTGAEQTLERSLQHESSAPVEDALIVLTSQRALSAQELEKSLRALLARQPGLSTASLRLAQLLAETGRTDEAASLTEATLARSVSARNMVVGARLLVQLGRVQQALDSAARGTREHPESAALHEVHGLLLAGTGRLEDGLAKLKKAADLEPENPSAPGHIAALLRESGRESEASEWQARANRASQAPKDGR
jgi:tetratricopeptide (TPR) repeat protein